MRSAIVKSSELGVNCWSPARFAGGRCRRVMECTYPEKKTCKAVQTEIEYLNQHYANKVEELTQAHKKAMTNLGQHVESSKKRLERSISKQV